MSEPHAEQAMNADDLKRLKAAVNRLDAGLPEEWQPTFVWPSERWLKAAQAEFPSAKHVVAFDAYHQRQQIPQP